MKRVFLVVLDSFGIGYAPDAADFGDVGANTLKTIYSNPNFNTPVMESLGLFHIDGIDFGKKHDAPEAAVARLREASRGKDTTIGHWEIAGIISEKPLPTYPNGFPQEIIDRFSAVTGRKVICNKPYSGTDVIRDYGEIQKADGSLIVYTSADSVFQIAAHEEWIGLDKLYEYSQAARDLLTGEHGVGRVIARPFIGEDKASFRRTANRHDYSIAPPARTMLNDILDAGLSTIGIGKIHDIFAGDGIRETRRTTSNAQGQQYLLELADRDFSGLCFVNLVDFDMLYGHRNDIDGYAKAASYFDSCLGQFLDKMNDDDVLIITADHGCDPGFPGTDHTREYVPMICFGKSIRPVNLGTRTSFADISATVDELLGVPQTCGGRSFAKEILR